MKRLGKLAVAVAVACVPAACKDDTQRAADQAAENLQEQREDLVEESRELKEAVQETAEDRREAMQAAREREAEDRVAGLPENATGRLNESEMDRNAEEIVDESEDVAEQMKEMQTASNEFEYNRRLRVDDLRTQYRVYAAQPMLINTLAGITPLTDRARNELNGDMQVFQMRLDEAHNLIEGLMQTDARNFDEQDEKATDAIERLDEASDEAWEALNEGDRIEPAA